VDDLPSSGRAPFGEFVEENHRNDPAPGNVTRLPGDPHHDPDANPSADDDHYLKGEYPSGFNNLANSLSVPNDEPSNAWERALNSGDRTNRVHFILSPSSIGADAKFRLRLEMTAGAFMRSGVYQSGFYEHDIEIRFRNSDGLSTELYSDKLVRTTTIDLEVPLASLSAKAGPNTIEFVRVGPQPSSISAWINFNYVQFQVMTPPAAPKVVDPFEP